jgi:hypothetical protein
LEGLGPSKKSYFRSVQRHESEEEAHMRVTFLSEGGIAHFPGLSKPYTIESATLPSAQAAELRQLIDSAHFFELTSRPLSARSSMPDARTYTIGVQEGRRRHTVRVAEPIADSELLALVEFLTAHRSANQP